MYRVADFDAFACAFELARGDGLCADEKVVEARRTAQTHFEGSVQDCGGFFEEFFGGFDGDVLQEALWTDSGPS